MSGPAEENLEIWRGNAGPLVKFTFPIDLTGVVARICVSMPEGLQVHSNLDADPMVSIETSEDGAFPDTVVFSPTALWTRQLPSGAVRYELELKTANTEITYIYGTMKARGGVNADG